MHSTSSTITFKQFLTEASRGADKWDKYFAAQDTETIIKSETALLDLNGTKVGTISKGESITVLAGEYDPKPRVRYNDAVYRISLNAIEKPTKKDLAVKINLKPDVLGLDKTIEFPMLQEEVKDAIDASSDVDGVHAEFLKALVDHAADLTDADAEARVIELFEEVRDDRPFISTINNDFMEVLGPFLVVNEKPEFADGDVIFPSAGNEPLYDFEMETTDTVQFSSKRAGGRTNTLKAEQIWKSVQDNPELLRRHKKELELLDLIKQTPVRNAPAKINEWLARTFKAYKAAPAPTTPAQITQLERDVVKWITTQSKLDFLPLIRDAIPDLWYVKARLNTDGTIKVEPLKNARDIQKAELRSKNSPNHIADKLGFVV